MPYMHSMRLALLAGIALTAAPVAHAADLGPNYGEPVANWSGFYIGGGIGAAFMDTSLAAKQNRSDSFGWCKVKDDKCIKETSSPQEQQKGPFLTLDQQQSLNADLGDSGFYGTAQLGYDFQMGRWVIGAFADADWYDNLEASASTSTSSALNLNLRGIGLDSQNGKDGGLNIPLSNRTINANVGVDWSWTVGGRFGHLVTDNVLLYALAAYTQVELDNNRVNFQMDDSLGALSDKVFETKINHPSTFSFNLPDSLNGFTLGGGGEVKFGNASPWSLKLEYRWTHLDGDNGKNGSDDVSQCIPIHRWFGIERDVSSTASARLDDLDIQTVRGVLTYRFGGAPEVASLK